MPGHTRHCVEHTRVRDIAPPQLISDHGRARCRPVGLASGLATGLTPCNYEHQGSGNSSFDAHLATLTKGGPFGPREI
jgi:hypothetical protein